VQRFAGLNSIEGWNLTFQLSNVEKWGCCGKKFLQRPLFYAILRTLLKNTYADSFQGA